MHRKRYFPADLEPYPLHYAALRGDTKTIGELISRGHNCFQPIQDGETPLHVAIAEKQTEAARVLFEEFRRHFELARKQFGIRLTDQTLQNRGVFIAQEDEQTRKVHQLETCTVPIRQSEKHILIMMKRPIGETLFTMIDPAEVDRIELFNLIESIIPNGIMSWDSTGPAGKCESLLMLAAYYGNLEIFELLLEEGANLDLAGPGKRTPFHAACEASQHKVIELILSKYMHRFDPTALDENAQHGLHYILDRKNSDSFEFVVEKMVEYRVQKFKETPSSAFNALFKLENIEWPYCGIWNQLDAAFWDKSIEAVLEQYKYDLKYQWKEVTALIDMISYKKAKKFYSKAIRDNIELLKVSSADEFTALHALICANEIKLVEELYKDHPGVNKLFETKGAFRTLSSVMQQGFTEMLKFVLSNHDQFFQENWTEIREQVIQDYPMPNNDVVFPILLDFVPDLGQCISERQSKMHEVSYPVTKEFFDTYEQLLQDFSSTHDRIRRSGKTLESYNRFHGNTFLTQALLDNQLELVKQLIDAKINLDYLDLSGRHAIHHVQSVEMLHLLIGKHPKGSSLVNLKDEIGSTLLHVICPSFVDCKKDLIVALLKLGAKLDERTNEKATALFYTYDEDTFKFLVEGIESEGFAPLDPELRDYEGSTALHRHLRHLNSHLCSIMLQSSKTFANFNDKGESYLAYLLRFERDIFDAVLKPVLEKNPDKTREMFEAELERSQDQASKLFVEACYQMNVYCIEQLLQMDLNFGARDDYERVGLLELLGGYEFPREELVFNLLDKRLDVNLQNQSGQNVLMVWTSSKHSHSAREEFNVRLARTLIERGLNLDHIDNKGDTAMHYAFRNGDFKLVGILLENGAICSCMNHESKKPFKVAAPYISQILNFLE
ncbi:putative ankyrin repeat protein RF_0381 [Armigeres subalbatus]|uniref:putative ankyrin repeat protein RF_0381 n=1 Tax=Armigeres subalbatus TaxID=124917 RepID=UPI002ED42222